MSDWATSGRCSQWWRAAHLWQCFSRRFPYLCQQNGGGKSKETSGVDISCYAPSYATSGTNWSNMWRWELFNRMSDESQCHSNFNYLTPIPQMSDYIHQFRPSKNQIFNSRFSRRRNKTSRLNVRLHVSNINSTGVIELKTKIWYFTPSQSCGNFQQWCDAMFTVAMERKDELLSLLD